jgi:hypothetical protein
LHLHREDGHLIERRGHPLRRDVEGAHRLELVAPEFQAHRRPHPEAVDVDDPAAHAVLGDILHHGDAREADAIEMRRQVLESPTLAAPQDEPRLGEGAREACPLLHRARGGEEHADPASRERLQRLHALPRDLGVWLDLAEPFARGIERHLFAREHRLQIPQPALRLRELIGDDDEEAVRLRGGECRDEHRIG